MSKDTKNKDLFDESNKVAFEYAKFENVGDTVQGVYVGKFNQFSDKYGPQTFENYVLVTDDGKKMVVRGRALDKSKGVKVIFGMEKIPLGSYIGFIYDRDYDTGKGNPAKIIEPRYAGEKKPDVLAEFQEMFDLSEMVESGEKTEETASLGPESTMPTEF